MDKETIKRGKITLIATNVTPNRFFYPMIRPIYDYFVLKSQELKTRSDQIMDGLFSTKVPEEIYPKSRLDWTGYLPGFQNLKGLENNIITAAIIPFIWLQISAIYLKEETGFISAK